MSIKPFISKVTATIINCSMFDSIHHTDNGARILAANKTKGTRLIIVLCMK